jgi:hypothetical protein
MRCSFLLLIAFATVVRPADLQAEASGGRTEAGGAFMSSYRAGPSTVSSGASRSAIRPGTFPRPRSRRR